MTHRDRMMEEGSVFLKDSDGGRKCVTIEVGVGIKKRTESVTAVVGGERTIQSLTGIGEKQKECQEVSWGEGKKLRCSGG